MPNPILNRKLLLGYNNGGPYTASNTLLLGLVAAYNMNGNSMDSTGGGLDGSDMNVTYAAGLVAQAGYYDGVTSQTLINDNVAFTFGSGDFTIAALIKRDGVADEIFVGQTIPAGGPANSSFAFGYFSNLLTGFFSDGASYITATAAATTIDTDWHNVIFRRSGNNITVYEDTVLMGTGDVTGLTMNDTVGSVGIGCFGQFPMNIFTGGVSSVFFWNRALNNMERERLWNNGNGLNYPF